jgi:hypothetical protein
MLNSCDSPSWVLSEARRKSLGVRCVPFSEAQATFFSVCLRQLSHQSSHF